MTQEAILPRLHRHDVFLSLAVGDITLTGLSPGYPIRGLRVDNLSGSWLTVRAGPYLYYVPPYIFNWQTPVTPAAAGVSVTYSGPPNTTLPPSTTDGQPARVDTYEDVIFPNPGMSFLSFSGNNLDSALIDYDSNVMTVGVVAAAIPTAFPLNRRAMLLQADSANTGIIYIGGPLVTANSGAKGGVQLAAGMSYPMDMSAQATVYAIASLAAQLLVVAESP